MDTAAGTVLFAVAGEGEGERGWVVEVRTGEKVAATVYPQEAGGRAFAGSIGPGAVFAVRDCGSNCLQAVRWEAGRWRPLGEPLRAPVVSTVHGTYDLAGRPWLVLHAPVRGSEQAADPEVAAWAFRLEDREWVARGTLAVAAGGSVAAVPAGDDAVVSGSARFAAGAPPASWLGGVPRLAAERRGEAVAVGGGSASESAAAYLDADGLVYLSRDGGATWARSEWTPWGVQRARIWQPGRDYTVDLPVGDRRGPLALAWFDRRNRAEERLLLTAWSPDEGWRVVADLAAQLTTLDGQQLNYNLLLVPRPGAWLLVTGCVFTRSGPGLVLRTLGPEGGLSEPRFVDIRPGG